MTNGPPYNSPYFIPVAPQAPAPLVPSGVLPDGRVVYTTSNPGTPSQPVMIAQAPIPPLTISATGHVIPGQYTTVPQTQPVHVHQPQQQTAADRCSQCPPPAPTDGGACAQCKPAEPKQCTVVGCTQCAPPAPPSHGWAVASATRNEAEHWVARILGFSLDYLHTLPPSEFQDKINVALEKAQDKPELQSATCPAHPHVHPPQAACAPRPSVNNRRETENWIQRMLGIPRPVLQRSSVQQLDQLVAAALANFRRR